jgi:hypothetical protein
VFRNLYPLGWEKVTITPGLLLLAVSGKPCHIDEQDMSDQNCSQPVSFSWDTESSDRAQEGIWPWDDRGQLFNSNIAFSDAKEGQFLSFPILKTYMETLGSNKNPANCCFVERGETRVAEAQLSKHFYQTQVYPWIDAPQFITAALVKVKANLYLAWFLDDTQEGCLLCYWLRTSPNLLYSKTQPCLSD